MTNRINNAQIEGRIRSLNELFGFKSDDVGRFILDKTAGGVALCRIHENDAYATAIPRTNRRDLVTQIEAMIDAVELYKRVGDERHAEQLQKQRDDENAEFAKLF